MKIIVSGKQLKITDAIKNYTEEKISKIFKLQMQSENMRRKKLIKFPSIQML